MRTEQLDPAFEELLEYIKESRGFDFTGYKRASLRRRFEKRMGTLRIDSLAEYVEHLKAHDDEFPDLFDTILINVTGFFRDPQAWELVRAEVVPRIVEARAGRDIRIWSTGCSTGEEAYTLAIVFAEALGEEAFRESVKIYATDVDHDALSRGRHAYYEPEALEPVPEDLRSRYFVRIDGGRYSFRPDLRRTVIFGRHDLAQDPPISRIDLLAARNTLMYFTPESQTRVLQNFNFALRPSGFLFLGKSEVLMTRTSLFEPYDLKQRVFVRVDRTGQRRRMVADDGFALGHEGPDESYLRAAVFEVSPTAQIVVDRQGILALANIQARLLFGLTPRDVGRPIQDLELSYRPVELRSRIDDVYAAKHSIVLRDVEWKLRTDEVRFVDIQLVPLATDSDFAGVGITVTDVTRTHVLDAALAVARQDAAAAYEDLQSTNEELETTNEELQSTNEELETTNEELQSTNEELETMNEELQSTNEELQAINEELAKRTDELHTANAFLASIVSGVAAGVAALDLELRVTEWSNGLEELWGLRADEAVGQHFFNLRIGLPVEQLHGMLRACIGDRQRADLELTGINRFGRPVSCAVACNPLVDVTDVVRGAILLVEATEIE